MADSEISLNVKLQGSKEFSKELDTVNKMAEFTEKDQYRLEMTTKNRLELINVIRELEASLRGAIQNQDADAIKATEEKLAIAKQQFEKLNQEQAMLQIQFAQQMQAGQQLAQSFDALSEGLGNFSESIENGTVNLAGMANSIIQVGMAVKAGLGPIAWIIAALQVLQNAYNSYAQTQKRIQELEKENKNILQAEKDLYSDLKQARAEYDAQVTQAKSLAALKTEYTAIKDRLAESLKLIEKSTRAELVRLSLIKDEEEFAQLQERYELGRSFKRGDISEEEYRKRIVELDKKKATAEAEREAAKAQAELAGKKAAAEQKSGVAETSFQAWTAADQALRGFKVSDAEISVFENKINEQKGVEEDYKKKLVAFLTEKGYSAAQAEEVAASKDPLKAMQKFTKIVEFSLTSTESDRALLNKIIEGGTSANQNIENFQKELTKLLGGRTVSDYKNARTIARQEEETRRNEFNAANEAARAAWQDYYNSPSARDIDIVRGKAIRAAEFEAEQQLKDIANEAAIAAADAKRAAELAAARGALTTMTGGDLKHALQNIAPGLTSTNTKDKAHAEALAEIYTAEQARRSSERVTYKKQYLSDKKFDASEIDTVFEMYDKGIEENNKALQSLAKYLLKNGQKYAETTADLKRIKNKLSDMQ